MVVMTRSTLKRVPDVLIIPDKGGKARLLGTGVLECYCKECKVVFWMRSNIVRCCPVCGGLGVEQRWTTPQVAFIPQDPV